VTVVGLRDSAREFNDSKPVVGSGESRVLSKIRDSGGSGGIGALTMAINLIKEYSWR